MLSANCMIHYTRVQVCFSPIIYFSFIYFPLIQPSVYARDNLASTRYDSHIWTLVHVRMVHRRQIVLCVQWGSWVLSDNLVKKKKNNPSECIGLDTFLQPSGQQREQRCSVWRGSDLPALRPCSRSCPVEPYRGDMERNGCPKPESLPWTSGKGCLSGSLSQEALGKKVGSLLHPGV